MIIFEIFMIIFFLYKLDGLCVYCRSFVIGFIAWLFFYPGLLGKEIYGKKYEWISQVLVDYGCFFILVYLNLFISIYFCLNLQIAYINYFLLKNLDMSHMLFL